MGCSCANQGRSTCSGLFDKAVLFDPVGDLTRRHAQQPGRLRLDPSCFPEGFSKTIPFDRVQPRGERLLEGRAALKRKALGYDSKGRAEAGPDFSPSACYGCRSAPCAGEYSCKPL